MANKHRGEIDIEIAGTTYAVAMTLEALAAAAEVLGAETLTDLEAGLQSMRIKDMRPLMLAILRANGHKVADADIAGTHFSIYVRAIAALYGARPGDGDDAGASASPRKRAA